MINRLIFILCIFCIVSTATACSHLDSKLDDNKWFLESYGTQTDSRAILKDTIITAVFDEDKREVSGSSGCNTYFASYEIDGNNLSISNLAWTERACISPAGVMEQEQEFLSLLADAESFQIDDTSLTITCSDGRYLYYIGASDK